MINPLPLCLEASLSLQKKHDVKVAVELDLLIPVTLITQENSTFSHFWAKKKLWICVFYNKYFDSDVSDKVEYVVIVYLGEIPLQKAKNKNSKLK